jgi:hypothetical protein
VKPYWVEVRRWQQRPGKPFFVRLGSEHGYQGFRSVYAYPSDIKSLIEGTGNMTGLGSLPVYSDMLFLDFDNIDPADTVMHLYDEGIGFTIWTSGNRSVHLHVAIEPMLGPHVPYSQRVWVEQHAPGADLSFYHHSGQFRLNGTPHEKTGKRKALISDRPGDLLTIPVVERPALKAKCEGAGGTSFMAHLLRRKTEGGRRVYVWHLAKQALADGIPLAVALERILWWNDKHAIPSLDRHQVEDKVYEVYRSHHKDVLPKASD